jgi:drug/metabolite transporter (DMT)-like permease
MFGVAFSTVGLAFLTLERNPSGACTLVPFVWQRGDLIVLGCAICFALHIITVSLFAPRTEALALTVVQVLVVALLSGVASWAFEQRPSAVSADIWRAAAFTGLLATAAAFAVQNSVQTWTTATHTALIFVTEPVFAALFGYLFAGERLTQQALVGGGLVLMGMLLAELQPSTHPLRWHALEGKESTR